MKKETSRKMLAAIVALLALSSGIVSAQSVDPADADQLEFPKILRQPEDRAAGIGSNTTFTVAADNADSYQWLRNGVVMEDQTNSTLTLENLRTADVGYYSCCVIKNSELVPTRSATLNVFAASGGGSITVFGLPVVSGGSQGGNCPGTYAGYVNYIKTAAQGWGWAPATTTTIHTATDGNRTDTKIVYLGKYSDNGCAQTSVTVPHPTPSPKYRFTIYFPSNVPTNTYPITLSGFNP